MAVIELDLDAPPASAPSRPPAHRYRPARPGSRRRAHRSPSAAPRRPRPCCWQQVGVVPAGRPGRRLRAGRRPALHRRHRSGRAGHHRLVGPHAAELWSTGTDQRGIPAGAVPRAGHASARSDGVPAAAPASSSPPRDRRRHRRGPLDRSRCRCSRVGAGLGVRQETAFPARHRVRPRQCGDPGELFWSSDRAAAHRAAAAHRPCYGVDLATGAAAVGRRRTRLGVHGAGARRRRPVSWWSRPTSSPCGRRAPARCCGERDAAARRAGGRLGGHGRRPAAGAAAARRTSGGTVAAYAMNTLEPALADRRPAGRRPTPAAATGCPAGRTGPVSPCSTRGPAGRLAGRDRADLAACGRRGARDCDNVERARCGCATWPPARWVPLRGWDRASATGRRRPLLLSRTERGLRAAPPSGC